MALFETSPSRSGSRFGKFSSNMFFTRNTAKPKRVRHIEGLNGALICNVNDDPAVVRSTSNSALGLIRPNLPLLETPRRVERLVPPMGFWNTYGVIQDTERWRHELASLATASGLGIQKDALKHQNRPPTTAVDQQHASRSGAHYSSRTGRFNEGTGKSRGRTGSKHGTAYSDMLFHVPENEREMWMLQVLCQLLGTSNLEDVQSWLVSASQTEKEQARAMINSALRGLKESERASNQTQQSVDLNSLSNFVEKQKNEEKLASQKYIKESLNRPASTLQSINEDQQIDNNLGDSWTNVFNNNSSSLASQNATTYQRTYQNFNRRSFSSFDTTSNNNNVFNENDENQEDTNNEQASTIQTEDDHHQRLRSISLTKMRKPSKQQLTPLGRSSSSHQHQHRIESLQINDDDDGTDITTSYNDNKKMTDENENEDEYDEQQRKDFVLPPIKVKETSNQDDDVKIRKIRELKTRLSRQEEESKKQITELQTKQSRLENALKLLTKQTSHGKRQNYENAEGLDGSENNALNESSKENARRQQERQQDAYSSDKQIRIPNMNKTRDDNRPSKSNSGVWKPDSSTLHRLQGNS